MSEWTRHWSRSIRFGSRLARVYLFAGTHGWTLSLGWTNENAKPHRKGRFFE